MTRAHFKSGLGAALLLTAVAWAAIPATAGAATPRGNYGGLTAQGEVATATVVKAHSGAPRIKRFAIHWVAPDCTIGAPRAPESTTFIANGAASAGGSFGPLQGTYSAPGSTAGTTQTFDWNLRGRVGSKKLTATFRLVVTEKDGAGNATFRCDTGKVVVALPHPNVFIGDTSDQDFGLVALRSSSPTSIKDFRIGWQAACTPPPGTSHTTAIAKLNVSKKTHRFSKTVPVSWTTRLGTHVAGTATLQGKRSEASVSGTFTFVGTATSASGQKLADCSAPKITFKARRK